MVPRKEKIQSYRALSAVFAAARKPEVLKHDFIPMEEQMLMDFAGLQDCLNALWDKPIADLSSLFYDQCDQKMLAKYNIELGA